jgi:gliding motility-associated-like protein
MKNIYIFIVILLFMIQSIYSQMDTTFWFVAPEVCQWNNPTIFDRPIKFIITSFSNNTINIRISQPSNTSFTTINNTIPPNGNLVVDMTSQLSMIENNPPNSVLNYGILIECSDFVNVYYEVSINGNNPEIYPLKGKNALGTDFLIPGQTEYMNGDIYQPTPLNRIDIVATTNNTVVTIIPSVGIIGHAANTPFSVTLQRGDTYCCAALGRQPVDHLEGTVITSNFPIAITVSDDLLNHPNSGQDLVGDQIVPTNIIGQEYIAIKGSLDVGADKIYILATVNNTSIYVNGSTSPTATINRGNTYVLHYSSGAGAVYFTTDYPVYAFQLTGMGIEFGAALLPPIHCTGSSHVKYCRGGTRTLKLNICIENGAQGNFLFNGSSSVITATDFTTVPGTNNNWLYASKDISLAALPSGSVVSLTNNSKFHVGVFEGGTSGGCSYGFFSDYSESSSISATTNHENNNNTFCEGDSICFQILNSNYLSSIQWTGPNNFSSTTFSPTILNCTTQNSGTYIVSSTGTSSCEIFPDTLQITVISQPDIDLGEDLSVCNNTVTLNAGYPDADYLWNSGQTTQSIEVTNSGTYWVQVNNNGCIGYDTINIVQGTPPKLTILHTGDFCEEGFIQLIAESDANEILWSTHDTVSTINITQPGTYTVMATTNGCSTSTSMTISCSCEVWLPNVFTPNHDNINDQYIPVTYSNFATFRMYIYNRWGGLIFQTDSLKPWNGKINGKDAPIGVYYCVIYYRCEDNLGQEITKHGSITLLR